MKKCPEYISLEDAWRFVRESFKGAGKVKEYVPIAESCGFVIAEDITAARNVPHYAASAVDGYALCASLTAGASAATPVVLPLGSYKWMNTGADMPEGADAVLMVEDSSLDDDGNLMVYKAVTPSMNVRPLGEDVMTGQIIAWEGDRVSPSLISLFLCAGLDRVPIYRRPKTLFIPTGDEIVPREKWLAEPKQKKGTVAESNSLFIQTSFHKWGFELDVADILPDNADVISKYVRDGTGKYDVVLIGAGSAKGRRDHTFEVLKRDGRVIFHWLRMKPGRPAIAASVNGKPVICLPGFPMSAAVVLWSIVYPMLKFLSSETGEYVSLIKSALDSSGEHKAKLLVQHSSPAGIREWLRVKMAKVGNEVYCWPLTSGASALWALAEADGIVMLPPSAFECEKGMEVNVWTIHDVNLDNRVLFQGSDDPAIQLLVAPIRRRGGDLVTRTVGSMGGLAALSRGECHLAAAHLLDERDGSYNDSFIERFSKGRKWVRILVFYRMQGIIVSAGNPKNIHSFKDFCDGDFVFANRQPGAGTRVLFDHCLKQCGKPASEIKGYEQQCATHMEAANRVCSRLADAALGIKSAADALGLDFIPLAEEPYELVIPEEHMMHPSIVALINALGDKEWRKRVERMGGYRWPK